jgi:hypothetical protein
MKKKAEKASTAFADTLTSLESATGGGTSCGSGGGSIATVKPIFDKLKACSTTAAAKCDASKIPNYDEALVTECTTSLGDWVKAFKACIKKPACCSCIEALAPVDDKCLSFDTLNADAVSMKTNCTSSSAEGSFGDCRAQQTAASAQGSCNAACGGGGGGSTPSSGGSTAAGRRRMAQRNELLKKWILSSK